MDFDREDIANFIDEADTAIECLQIAPLPGNRAAILFLISDPDYTTTLSVIFIAEDFEPQSARGLLFTDDWLMALSATPSGELFALEATTWIWRQVGTEWTRTKVSEPSLRTVWAEDPGGVLAVGSEGSAFRLEAGEWRPIPPVAPVEYLNIHGNARNGIYACGDQGTLHRLEGTAWTVVELHRHDLFHDVDVAPEGTIRLAGDDGVCLRIRDEEVVELATSGLSHLAVRSFGDRAYWGDEAGLHIEVGNALQPFQDTGIASDLRTDGRMLYVAGLDTAWRYDGRDWKTLTLVFDAGLRLA